MKDKKCKYCDEMENGFLDSKTDGDTYTLLSFNNKNINVYCSWQATDDCYSGEAEIDIKINYCPFCGRKL